MHSLEAGRVDTVVVYKVDRLTRSLADFAKIVDAFDATFGTTASQFRSEICLSVTSRRSARAKSRIVRSNTRPRRGDEFSYLYSIIYGGG